MARYEILNNGGDVENVLVADLGFVEAHYPGCFREVPEPELPAPSTDYGRIITVLAFRQRFTMTEKTAIELASIDNPSAPLEERQKAASLRAYLGDLSVATCVDLSREDTISSVQQLEDFGLLASGRAAEIIDSPVLLVELPLEVKAKYAGAV